MKHLQEKLSDIQRLKNVYYDARYGLKSPVKMATTFKLLFPESEITKAAIIKWVKDQQVQQLQQEVKKPIIYSTIVAPMVRHQYYIDIMIYNRYAYGHYKYVLGCIDVYSRFVHTVALTNRREETILKALKLTFKKMGFPKNINADQEFNTKKLNNFFKINYIQTHFSHSEAPKHTKNSLIERFFRTLANMLQKYRLVHGKNWVKALPMIIQNYNTSVHRTIKETPHDVFIGGKPSRQTKITKVKIPFVIGDRVRIRKIKDTFDKGDINVFSSGVYDITRIIGEKIFLKNEHNIDLLNPFKFYELLKINKVST
ncbi:unnamed protein product, partial [Heterosigma akashiwo]